MVAVDVLLGRGADESPPDVVLSIVDASNLERNLFLISQVLALGLPTVVALNMVDLARDRQIEIDVAALAERLGVPVVPIQANRRQRSRRTEDRAGSGGRRETDGPRESAPGRVSTARAGDRQRR